MREVASYSGGTAADTSVSSLWWQQCERLWLGWVLSLSILWALWASHFTDITDALQMGTNDVLGGFNHPLQSLPVLGHAQTILICDVFSQNALYTSSEKADNNLALKSSLLKFVWKVEPFLCFNFLTRVVMCDDHDRFSDVPRNQNC